VDASEWGIQLDDIKIYPAPTEPILVASNSLGFGTIYNNIPYPTTRQLSVKNDGAGTLNVTGITGMTEGLSTSTTFPVAIPAGESRNIAIVFDGEGFARGNYRGSFVVQSNDAQAPTHSVNVTASIEVGPVSDYIFENFNDGGYAIALPFGWSGNFERMRTGGIDNSGCAVVGLTTSTGIATGTLRSSYVNMGSNPILRFHYRTIFNIGGPAVSPNNYRYRVEISENNGATWVEVLNAAAGSHQLTEDFITINADVSAFANKLCQIRIIFDLVAQSSAMFVLIDDVIIGTPPGKDMAALAIDGNLTPSVGIPNPYTVTIKNWGGPESNYTVRLMRGETVLASVQGPRIDFLETKDVTILWTPTDAGQYNIYGEVVLVGDENPSNTKTRNLGVNVQPAGTTMISIWEDDGSGLTYTWSTPFVFNQPYSLSQSMYYAHEIKTNGGKITQLDYDLRINSTLRNAEIQIWIGETNLTDMHNFWVPASTMTMVYDGPISFNFTGTTSFQRLKIPLQIPYEYGGRNLVVYVHKKQGYGGGFDVVKSSTSPQRTVRTRFCHDFYNQVDPHNPQTDPNRVFIHRGIPDIFMTFDMSEMGTLSGVIDDVNGPLQDVTIQIAGTNFEMKSTTTGNYIFPYLAPGTYSVTYTKYGYHDETRSVTVTQAGTTTQNVTMTALALVTVRGTITTSDTDAPIEGVKVDLLGYTNYTTTTNSLGQYTIEGVHGDHTYELHASILSRKPYSQTVIVQKVDVVRDFTMDEIPFPVIGVSALLDGVTDSVTVTWGSPANAQEKRYILDDGTWENGVQFLARFEAVIGNRFVTGESGELLSIDVFGMQNTSMQGSRTVTLDIYNENRQLVWQSNHFLLEYGHWQTITVPQVPYSGTFYAMIHWYPTSTATHTTNFLAADHNGPNATTNPAWTIFNDSWALAHEVMSNGTPPFVTGIRAHAYAYGTGSAKSEKKFYDLSVLSEPQPEKPIKNTEEIALFAGQTGVAPDYYQAPQKTGSPTKTFTGDFEVYRFTEGQAQNQWQLMGTTSETTYNDGKFSELAPGAYKWAVIANYSNNVQSEPRISNMLDKDMFVPYTINISTTTGTSPVGAIITLTHSNGNPDYIYKGTANSSGVLSFSSIRRGLYDIKVELPKHASHLGTLQVAEAGSHNVSLGEIPYPVSNAMAAEQGNNVVITWENAVEPDVFRYDNGVPTSDQIGYNQGTDKAVIGSVHRVDAVIEKMSWYLGVSHSAVNVFVFDLDEQGRPTNKLLFSQQNVPNGAGNQWIDFTFPMPIYAPNGFFLALSHNSARLEIVMSEVDTEYPYKANTHFFSADYTNSPFIVFESNPTSAIPRKNIMLRAEGYINGVSAKFGEELALPKSAVGYEVYRLIDGAPENEWTSLSNNVTGLTYTDNAWGTLPDGLYRWAIKAKYPNDVLSPARLTNRLTIGYEFPYTVNLTTNSGDPVVGAEVKLSRLEGDFLEYKQLATGNAVVFPYVWGGTYKLTVTLDGFNTYTVSSVEIPSQSSINIQLIEQLTAPVELKVDVNGSRALFSWNNDRISFFDDMENYENFIIEDIGEYTLIDLDSVKINSDHSIFPLTGFDWPNKREEQAFIVFNPSQTTPPYTNANAAAYSGSKYLACFAAPTQQYGGTGVGTTTNNDYLILPPLHIVNGSVFKFMARGITTLQGGSPRIRVVMSTTGTNVEDFKVVLSSGWMGSEILGIGESWTELSFDLSAYAGQEVYLAINCVSWNSGPLMIDDIFVGVPGKTSYSKAFQGFNVYLDGVLKASNVSGTQYEFLALTEGTYTAGVEAVYTTGKSAMQTISFSIGDVTIPTYIVSIQTPANGTITVMNGNDEVSHGHELIEGTELTLTATPHEGYKFVKWTHDNHIHANHTHTLVGHVTISAEFSEISSIGDLTENRLLVYPNPVFDVLNIQTEQVIKQIVVLDLNGRIVMQLQGNIRTIDLQSIPAGNYIVNIRTETAIIPIKIVKNAN
jgi:hypothetical protein